MTPEREQEIRNLHEGCRVACEIPELLAEIDALRAKQWDFRRWLQQHTHARWGPSAIRRTRAMFDRIVGAPPWARHTCASCGRRLEPGKTYRCPNDDADAPCVSAEGTR